MDFGVFFFHLQKCFKGHRQLDNLGFRIFHLSRVGTGTFQLNYHLSQPHNLSLCRKRQLRERLVKPVTFGRA